MCFMRRDNLSAQCVRIHCTQPDEQRVKRGQGGGVRTRARRGVCVCVCVLMCLRVDAGLRRVAKTALLLQVFVCVVLGREASNMWHKSERKQEKERWRKGDWAM